MTSTTDRRKANQAFREAYGGGKNVVSPFVLDRGMIDGDTAYEISAGEGIDHGSVIVGVTVVVRGVDGWAAAWRTGNELSRSFVSSRDGLTDDPNAAHVALKEARDYVAELRGDA